ncbi:hypothetical protein K523DRAFT_358691 [Schizophyllum commune Tattone D]|nr:hypothetical protein K523DRAFT_358691 [Schizophyllum commune Tattone D]
MSMLPPSTALLALWRDLLAVSSALHILKIRAHSYAIPDIPLLAERAFRTERRPFEYSSHREFTAQVLGVATRRSAVRGPRCLGRGFGICGKRVARVQARAIASTRRALTTSLAGSRFKAQLTPPSLDIGFLSTLAIPTRPACTTRAALARNFRRPLFPVLSSLLQAMLC